MVINDTDLGSNLKGRPNPIINYLGVIFFEVEMQLTKLLVDWIFEEG